MAHQVTLTLHDSPDDPLLFSALEIYGKNLAREAAMGTGITGVDVVVISDAGDEAAFHFPG